MEVAVCSGTLRQQQQPEVLAGERVGPRTDAGSSSGGLAMGMERQGDEDEACRGSKAEQRRRRLAQGLGAATPRRREQRLQAGAMRAAGRRRALAKTGKQGSNVT